MFACLLALCALAPATPALAQVSFPDIEDEVMCDTCNVPLNIAEAPRADQLRREINKLIARGESKEQIKLTLSERYGPAILALPPASGFSLSAYLVPVAVAIGLLLLGIVLLRRWRILAAMRLRTVLARRSPSESCRCWARASAARR